MILSVSRRTDIPAFYGDWFMNRIKEGFVYVRNPFNAKQISNVNIKPEVVDCVVFWSKNPEPFIRHLDELDRQGYKYYFQYTITPYNDDLERNIKDKKEIINTFIKLSEKIGKEKVILRYDPIIITKKYSKEFHFKAFLSLCEKLKNHTNKVVISFLDDYRKVSRNMAGSDYQELRDEMVYDISRKFASISRENGLQIETCAEKYNFEELGINKSKCIDGGLIESITGYNLKNKEKLDANRKHCCCMKCIDIGQYDSCIHNCLYCYANINKEKAKTNYLSHDPCSPLLFGDYDERMVNVRKDVKSFKIEQEPKNQMELF